MKNTGYSAYQRTTSATESSRDTEYRLLGAVNAALREAVEGDDKRKTIGAVLWNKQVWDHFVMDCLHEDNQLPKSVRSAIANIGVWVNQEVNRILDGKGDINGLIDINQIIMKGLKPAGESAEDSAAGDRAAPSPASWQNRPGGGFSSDV